MKKYLNFFISNFIIVRYFLTKIFLRKKSLAEDFSIVVVSMDRPFSLRSFLLSIEKFFEDPPRINVIIKSSSDGSYKRYEQLKLELQDKLDISFYYEKISFKYTFQAIIKKLKTSKIMLCVDDQIFTQRTGYNEVLKSCSDADFFTLRFGLHTNYSYNLNKKMEEPFRRWSNGSLLIWPCAFVTNDFHYPMSFDATIFDKSILRLMSRLLLYSTPNQFEGYMNYGKYAVALFGLRIGCFTEQRAVNIVLNKVQKDNNNKSLGISLEILNRYFDQGKYLVSDRKAEFTFTSSHTDQGYALRNLK